MLCNDRNPKRQEAETDKLERWPTKIHPHRKPVASAAVLLERQQ